jgi:hypothetical protein
VADIVHQIPWQLSNYGGTGQGGNYGLQDVEYDYAVGGIPFLSATRDQWPYTEGMAPIRKEQFDSFAEPGEQSLQGWWLRSQSDWGQGAGVLYQDPDQTNTYLRQHNTRFNTSLGIDSWTAGNLKLLRDSQVKQADLSGTPMMARGFVDPGGVDSFWHMNPTTLTKVTESGTTPISEGAGTNNWITSSGATYWLAKNNGLWSGTDTASAVQSYTSSLDMVEFIKGRLIGTSGPNIYILTPTGGGPALPTPTYTHLNPNFKWTSISEGPNAFYVAGNDGTTGYVYKFTIDTSTATAVIGAGIVSATLPTGELINTIYSYIGTFLVLATSKGLRISELDSQGDVNYGPLLFNIPGGCRGIIGYDHYVWAGSTAQHDGSSGLYRVDLGEQVQGDTTSSPLRYAYSRDLYLSGAVGAVTSVTMFGASDRKVYTIPGSGSVLEASSTLIPEGYLTTGRIRFNTEEPKLYKFFSVRTPALVGDLEVSLIPEGGGEINYVTYGPSFAPGQGDIATPQPPGPQNWIELKFTLRRNPTTTSTGAVMNGWQVKALPGSIRQRIITQTFLLFDEETDKGGQRNGYDGYARSRLEAFKELARKGDVVVFQELIDETLSLVVIDDWKYTQLSPPGADRASLGGYLTAVMRTVAEAA